MEVDDRTFRDLEARIMNLEVRDVPVSKHDIEKRWLAVRETIDDFGAELRKTELDRRGFNDTLGKFSAQVGQAFTMLSSQSVQIQDMQEQLNTVVNRLAEHLEECDGPVD